MSYVQRSAGVLHRSNVSAADKLATPAAPTTADIATGGALLASTTYKISNAVYTAAGVSAAPAAASQATAADASNTHGIRAAVAQVVGALGYDIFCSVDAAPKWVGRITEAQRAAGVAIRSVGGVGGDVAADIAGKIRTALAAHPMINAAFTVTGATTAIILTDRTKRANDTSLNIKIEDGTSVGVATLTTSTNTTAGVAPVKQVETATLAGAITGAGNVAVIVTANGMTNSPKTVNVAVVDGDTAAIIAGKIRTALAADVDVSAFFTVSGTTTAVILTAITKAANDATMNINVADGTSHGVTTAAASADTTAGVAPVAQVETATIVGTIGAGGAGNAKVTVTAAGMTNSPKVVTFAVANNDTASQVGGKARTALAADTDVNGFFVVSGAGANIILTARTAAANDATLNIASDNDTCTGLTAAPTSTNTTAGVAGVLQVETATVAGAITGAGNATITVTASGMTNSPKAISVAVVDGDTAALIAGKVRTALAADTDVAAFFTVSGTGTAVILTAIVAASNDATMNVASTNGTCFGITPAANSANTTAGVAGTAQVETATVPTSLVTVSGNAKVTVTGANLYNSPAVVMVAVSAAASVAGSVDILVAGTGVISSAAPFAASNAYTPQLPTAVPCAGFSKAYVHLKVKPTFAGAPSISLIHFIQNQLSSADWHQFGAISTPTINDAVGKSMEIVYEVDVDGAAGFVVLLEAIANAAADIWVELA